MRISLWLSAGIVAMVGVLSAGCQTVAYRGASPSARILTESPRELKDFYLGFNFAFSLDHPIDYRRPDGPAVAMSAPSAPAVPIAQANLAEKPSDN